VILHRLDDRQQRHAAPAFAWAVIRKYLDDRGAREAALITYYGFLSLFPALLLGVAILTRVLAGRPGLRQALIAAIVPPALQPGIDTGISELASSDAALVAGLIGLVFSGTGVVFSAYETLNHLAGIPFRDRGVISRYPRVVAGLAAILAGAVAAGLLTVAVAALPASPWVSRAVTLLGSGLIGFGVLLLVARLLLARRAPLGGLWPAAAIGAVAVVALLNLGASVLPELIRRAGRVYGAFAGVAGVFTLLYLLSNVLVLAAEIAVVRHARLWPRALDPSHPAPADRRAMEMLAREQERTPGDRVTYARRDSPG
jgi:membrane protein